MTSLLFLLSACLCNLLKKTSTSSISQSLLSLVNTGFQWPTSPDWSHNWATQASLEETRVQTWKNLFQGILSMPPILPELHSSTIPHFKTHPFAKLHPLFPNRLPQPHFVTFPWSTRTPTSLFPSIFSYNHLFP